MDNISPVIVTKLKKGMVFKNYKKLCEFLNEKEMKANSKNAQQKEWLRYFNYEKDGQKYIITEIYPEPLPKDDKRMQGNNSEYLPYIELILLDYLSKQNSKTSSLTIKNLFLLLGMVNQNYVNEEYKIDDENINQFYIEHFNQRAYKKLNRILYDALNNLKNRRLIDYENVKMINIEEVSIYGINTIIREATPEECDIIRNEEREVLLSMGLESIVQVHLKYKTKLFYKKVQEHLSEKYGINYYFTQINMRFTHTHVLQAKSDMATKILLNNKIVDVLNKDADTKLRKNLENYDKNIMDLCDGVMGNPNPIAIKNIFRYDEEAYKYSQKQLAEYLIRINNQNIS